MDKYIGQMLDNRYELLEVIGTGGMAVVYKAMCHRLNRLVAVKILKEEFAADEEFRRRFHTESQAVAMLSHSNIVSVYDVSRSDNRDYIVMELIDGITLKQYMNKVGAVNWRETLHYITQIVSALSHAHSRGIVHRDIKPHNIMLLRDGSVKVTDFGIARLTNQQMTLTQEALGSVHYISPEQAKGEPVDERSDIYSVGVVMYEMLTGRLPFEGDSAVSVAIQHISSIPLMPRDIDPDIPAGIEAITMKAMTADMNMRYPNAEALLADLEEFRKNPEVDFGYIPPVPQMNSEPTKKIPVVKTTETRSTTISRGSGLEMTRDEYYVRRKRAGRVAIFAGSFLVLLLVVFLGMTFKNRFLDLWFGEGVKVPVPSIVGKVAEDVIKTFQNDPDFKIVVGSTQASSEYEEGVIIEQSPVGGSSVDSGTTITVIVSSGRDYILMPDLLGDEYHAALVELQRLGLECEPDFISSDDVAKDYVISQVPESGAELNPGDTVYMVVSLGSVVSKIPTPSLVGTNYDVAVQRITSMQLSVGKVDWVYDKAPEGEVIFQSIVEGTEVEPGTSINMQVSRGPMPVEEDPVEDEPTDPAEPTEPGDPNAPADPSEPAEPVIPGLPQEGETGGEIDVAPPIINGAGG